MSKPKVMPETLMDLVINADAIRRKSQNVPLSTFPRWKRIWIEPWFNLLGLAFGQTLKLLPWSLRWKADLRINQLLARHQTATSADLSRLTPELAALATRLHAETGQWPGTLIFTSHPPTVGPLEWLRFEVLRHALILSNAVVDATQTGLYRSAPECFLAIDPYALDTLPAWVAGFYSGWMHRVYLVWDRQPSTQSWIQRQLFLRDTGYTRILWRLLKRLKQGVPVLMVVSGGLPFNARLLYAAREFIQRVPVTRWPYSKRAAQEKLLQILMQPVDGVLPAEAGLLPEPTRQQIRGLLNELGIPGLQQPALFKKLEQEFALEIPYRERLFRILFRRLVDRGTPLLWMAVSHSIQEPLIRLSAPWAVFRDGNGDLRLLRNAKDLAEPCTDLIGVIHDFAQSF